METAIVFKATLADNGCFYRRYNEGFKRKWAYPPYVPVGEWEDFEALKTRFLRLKAQTAKLVKKREEERKKFT